MPFFLELLVLLVVLVYGVRAVSGIVRAVREDAGAGGRRRGGGTFGAGRRGEGRITEERAPVRWPEEPDVEDARWVDLD